MGRSQYRHDKKKHQKQAKRKEALKNRTTRFRELSPKNSDMLCEAQDLINAGEFDEARKLLIELDNRTANHPDVIKIFINLCQFSESHRECLRHCIRLLSIVPNDVAVRAVAGYSAMFCGWPVTALEHLQYLLSRWPDCQHAARAQQTVDLLLLELEERRKVSGFSEDEAYDILRMHEECLQLLHGQSYSKLIEQSTKLIAKAPQFVAARNNLSIGYYQLGQLASAISTLESAVEIDPQNEFSKAQLAKYYFLAGRAKDAQNVVDRFDHSSTSNEDALKTTMSALAMLGRDEELKQVAEKSPEAKVSPDGIADRLHFLAYAHFRLGDQRMAKKFWQECLTHNGNHELARENLDDLSSNEGHAPWALPLSEWVGNATIEGLRSGCNPNAGAIKWEKNAVKFDPTIVEGLLDRGDPSGRRLATLWARREATEPMFEALKKFAFGQRGPDSFRLDAIKFLSRENFITGETFRLFHRGKWKDIALIFQEVHSEPTETASPRVAQWLEQGTEASHRMELESAEIAFEKAIAEDPNCLSAIFNLCTVWMRRDGKPGELRARRRIEELHRDFPDYFFAAVALAQFALKDNDVEKAKDLLAQLSKQKRLHISEAKALYGIQLEMALHYGELESAEVLLKAVENLTDESDHFLLGLKRLVRNAKSKMFT